MMFFVALAVLLASCSAAPVNETLAGAMDETAMDEAVAGTMDETLAGTMNEIAMKESHAGTAIFVCSFFKKEILC